MVKVKHINAKPSPSDGERIYIDRLWTDSAYTRFVAIAEWDQAIAPSYDLWRFHFDPQNWDQFVDRYHEELKQNDKQNALKRLFEKSQNGTVTLLYGNGDAQHNCALILQNILVEMSSRSIAA